jgi:hypothetical protein
MELLNGRTPVIALQFVGMYNAIKFTCDQEFHGDSQTESVIYLYP